MTRATTDVSPNDPVANDPVANDPVPNDPVPNDPVPNDPVPIAADVIAQWRSRLAAAAGGTRMKIGLHSVESVLRCPRYGQVQLLEPFTWTSIKARRRLASKALEVLRNDRRFPTPHQAAWYALGDLEPSPLRDWIDQLGTGGRLQIIDDVVRRTVALCGLVAHVPSDVELNPSASARCGAAVLEAQADIVKGDRYGWCLEGPFADEKARRQVTHMNVVQLLGPKRQTIAATVFMPATGRRVNLRATDTELNSWIDALEQTIGVLGSGTEAARLPGPHCRWCPERRSCPASE
jgi:hypothetical protein